MELSKIDKKGVEQTEGRGDKDFKKEGASSVNGWVEQKRGMEPPYEI